MIEGALFRVVKRLVDHCSRNGFGKATRSWWGEEAPESAKATTRKGSMATKTTRTDQVKLALERLLRDEEVQGQLHTAARRLQEATARARSRRPAKAAADKQVYAKVREAAMSLTQAARSLGGRPKPKHRGRRAALAAAGAGLAICAVVALKKRGKRPGSQPAEPVTEHATPAATPMPPPDASV